MIQYFQIADKCFIPFTDLAEEHHSSRCQPRDIRLEADVKPFRRGMKIVDPNTVADPDAVREDIARHIRLGQGYENPDRWAYLV
jgi:hypothetical protein